ncbi:hypothetical protein MtrunA17_Chr3g0117351 [Medicago truncatula]|uniref:Transmembrane protein n=1 Tax=Medicago truncatula TaxID=3880 RepID=A0A396IVV3_MEDTR|nr:hypothetical protein MtrunA17_Chr3g0117351 [Medicago truncatula]
MTQKSIFYNLYGSLFIFYNWLISFVFPLYLKHRVQSRDPTRFFL